MQGGGGSHLLRKDRVLSLQHAHQRGQMPEVRVDAGGVEVHHGGRTWSPGCTGQSEDGNPWWQGQCLSTATQNEEVARRAPGRDHRGRIPALREQWQEQDKEIWGPQ